MPSKKTSQPAKKHAASKPRPARTPPPPANVAEAAEGRTNLFSLRRKYIIPALLPDGQRLNTRTDFGDLDMLARSIARHGIKTAVLGTWRDGRFYADDGERRMKAYDIAVAQHGLDPDSDLGLIPVNRQAKGYTDAQRTVDLLTCNLGQPLNGYERALSMHRLAGFGYDEARIAQETAYSVTHVRDCLRLILNASAAVQHAVASGLMSFTLASELVREVNNKEEQNSALAAASAAAQEAGAERITQRHLPVKTGKEKQATRRHAPAPHSPPDEPENAAPVPRSLSVEDRDRLIECIECVRSEGKASASLLQRRLRLGYQQAGTLLEALVAREFLEAGTLRIVMDDLQTDALIAGLKPSDPFAGKEVTAPYLDDEGRFIDEIRLHPVRFAAAGVTGGVQLATHLGAWYGGFTLKWPGQSREDGYLKVAPSIRGRSFPINQLAELAALQAMRGELETKDFESRTGAILELNGHIRRMADALPSEHRQVQTGHEGGAAPVAVANPVLRTERDHLATLTVLDGLLTDIPAADAEKDRLKTVKIIRHLLAGKHDRKEVVKYLLGIIDTVAVVKGGAK